MSKIALMIGADLHCGSKVGLLRSGTWLYDPGLEKYYKPELTKYQQYLNEILMKSVAAFSEFAAGWPCAALVVGDPTQGNKYPTMLVSDRIADQPLIAIQALEPIYALPNLTLLKIIVGTEAHNFGAASAEIMICELARRQFPKIETTVSYHPFINFAGLPTDIAHHGPGTGLRTWLHGNNVRYFLRNLMMDAIIRGKRVPRLVLAAHVHDDCYEYVEVGDYRGEIYVLPSMCGMSDHGIQATHSAGSIVNGFLYLAIEDGRIVKAKRDYHRLDLRSVENVG